MERQNMRPEFKEPLTPDEINSEIDKVNDFFERVPEDLKAITAQNFICEIVNWACSNTWEGIGIFYEAMNRFREASRIIEMEAREKEKYDNASNTAQGYYCFESVEGIPEIKIGEHYLIGNTGHDSYFILLSNENYIEICLECLKEHFKIGEE